MTRCATTDSSIHPSSSSRNSFSYTVLAYIIRRVLLAVPTLFGISVLSFVIMHLPPGDFLSSYAAVLGAQGEGSAAHALGNLRQVYGLVEPLYVQYWKCISGILLHGDFGL